MSEPKTPDEFLREISSAFQALYPSADALDNAVGAIAARDEQIRQQERARVAELESVAAAAIDRAGELSSTLDSVMRTHVSKERVRELIRRLAEHVFDAEAVAGDLGIDLEDADETV